MTRLRLSALAIAILTAGANFILVHYMLGSVRRVLIPGLADFSPTLNPGVSFGLLTPDSPIKYHLLIALLVLITLFVGFMSWRATTSWASVAYGLILGGALGNLSDRLLNHGAVFDFLALHLGRIPLFVCNFPDVVITVGVILLLAVLLLEGDSAKDVAV